MSPTERSKELLRQQGYGLIAVVERWNAFAHCRQDLFGFIDILAANKNETLGIQVTTQPHAAERVDKIRATQASSLWLESAHRRIVVHAWAKRGGRGKRKLWTCNEIEVR